MYNSDDLEHDIPWKEIFVLSFVLLELCQNQQYFITEEETR